MKRYSQLIRIRPEKFEAYKAYHAKVWPEVLETIRKCHIRNYSIFHWKGLLFPSRTPSRTGPRASGGPRWKRSFTRIEPGG